MRPSIAIAAALTAGSLVTTAGARAQTWDDNYSYRFEDDALVGDTLSTPPPRLRVPPKGRRVLLIRPRVTFVAELIATVEKL